MGEYVQELTDCKDPVSDGVEDSMYVVERSKDGLERQTFSCCFILAVVSRITTLKNSHKKPGSSEEGV